LRALGQRVEFDNATKALIREIEGGLPPDDGGGGMPLKEEPSPSSAEPHKGGGKRSFEEIKALIDSSPSKGRNMALIGRENFSPDVVDYLLEFKGPSKKIAIEHLEPSKAQELGFKYPTDVRRTIDKSEIIHVLERHGENGTIKLAREQPPVTKEDIAKYPQYTDEADVKVLGKNHAGEVIISGKQINGHYVVVEQIRKGQNELAFKTMYFERGDLRNNPAFDSVMLQEHPKHPSYELGLGQTTDTRVEANPTTPDLKNQEGTDLPTKSTLKEELSPQEIKSHIEQWDLTNPKATDKLLIGKVEGKELEQLSQEFKFNGNYALARQIDAQHVAHALNRHGDLKVETSRNQIPITLEDISNYPNIVKSADIREVEGNNIIYKKQINGHYVVVEEALTKKNKISFVTMWKGKGDLTTLPTPSSKGYDLDRTLSESYKDSNPTTQELKNQATTLYNTAKEQEAGFKELLEGLKGPSSSLEATNTLKSLQSLQEKLAYYKGDTSKINDTLRGAVLTDKQAFDSQFMRVLENLENNPNTTNITPNFIKTQDGYQGVHINFDFNGVTSELQIHTPKSWAVKKKLDPLYKEKRRLYLEGKLSNKDIREFKRKMKAIGQESDLDSSLFTSSRLISPQASSTMSVLAKKSGTDLKDTQEPLLKSNSNPGISSSGNAYNLRESKLNQKSTSLTGGKGIDIQTPLDKNSTQGLKDKPLLLTYKNTQELVTHAKAEGLSPARIGQLVQERKQAIAGLLPFKREVDIKSVIFKEDIKNNAQILLEGKQAYLSHAQLLQALSKAKELRSTSPSAHTLVQHKQSRLAQLQDNTLAHQWLEAFNLKSLDEPFIPQFSPAVQQALEPILKGEQIQLTRGSLVKLAKRQREEFLPLIRPTLESPNLILDDGQGLLFIKEFIDPDKNRYFMSVAKNYSGEWVFSSHTKRQPSAIRGKIQKSKVLYNAGFSGGEVAGASDILESGGTAIKPSDLQINTPPSHSSALNPAKPEFSTPALKGKRARVKKLQEALIQNFLYDYKESGNETLISQLKNFLNDEDFIRTLPKKTLLAVEHGLARENPHIVRENLENIEQIASKIEKLDPKGVTPDMRRVIAHMEELNVRQEKELLEIKGLYEELVGKWEKMHGEKSGALFPERYTVGNKSKETDLPTKSNLKEVPLKNIEPNPAFGENFSEFEGKGAQVLLDGRGRADLLDPKKLSKVEQESGEVKPSAVIQSPEEKEAFIKSLDLRTSATPIPASLDVEGFLKSLKEVKNHKRFIEHLASREDKQRRLGFLNLVEPTLNHPDFVMLNNDVGRKKYAKVFQKDNGKHLTYLLVTAEDDKLLITGIPDVRRSYIIKEIKDADIIYSFIRPGS
ncbi:PBECR3 domain-containing polyvalent protein, partial [Helicobacter felis]|uniref:PBECR3 domain-containing polyvalent protein n=1 Tax=Helicobacter felis TaxID=214 RepID=UPI00227715F9